MKSRRRWLFRIAAIFLAPLFFLAAIESLLRLSGYGHATGFLLSRNIHQTEMWTPNLRFGWRFFGRELARQPAPFAVSQQKSNQTVRVFVFGESAAYGDPLPEFGLPRLLQALLELRFPRARFEIVNAAMTGINSHAVLPIARDCARASGDIWVIYLGNNEVVGPFGPGTVFGRQSPPLPWIRASLAAKSTRSGQLLDHLRSQFNRQKTAPSEWGGMRMFINNRVSREDARMPAVYAHFTRNLSDIFETGIRSGARIVLSTVAVNLRDCAPFASMNRPDLSASDILRWEKLYREGIAAERAGKDADAIRLYEAAARLDDHPAELHFRWARCLQTLHQLKQAQDHFALARDLDALRFRCDSGLNKIIRQTAAQYANRGIRLADAEAVFARESPEGITGAHHFLEHVHLTFEGNYLLAQTIAREIEMLLPETVRGGVESSQAWPSLQACAQRLCWGGWSRHQTAAAILSRLYEPPYPSQINHPDQVQRWIRELEQLQSEFQPPVLREAETRCAQAAQAWPEDWMLQTHLAKLRLSLDNLPGALEAAHRIVALLPCHPAGWHQLALVQMQQKDFEAAILSCQAAIRADPDDYWALEKLGRSLAAIHRTHDAIRAFRQALTLQPRLSPAYLGLGQLLEQQGRNSEAESNFRLALQNRVHLKSELTELADFCQNRGWYQAALTNYLDALRMSPTDALLHLSIGRTLNALQRPQEAQSHFTEAMRLNPNLAATRFLLG
ncbi:MAG TPA: tetratricopeptide repeat protein, partial [Verrucomicrobiota bacterium]|nr:tetratricopeptide repeat protein [Verrucomicrobiota bacterium]